ncbi:MAG: hypothetical protein JSS76_17700 [Bacteroidetes bacterium]|nr:hypothetical protein [Bacteroidota bacterium]
MKSPKILLSFLILCLLSSFTLYAQDDREDVVYLKNGNVYRGVIIEQVPGQTLKVETLGGNVFTVQISDITKITKEKKVLPDNGPAMGGMPGEPPMHGPDGRQPEMNDRGPRFFHHNNFQRYYKFDSAERGKNQFHYRKKGYFFEAQLLAEMGQGGGRIINGYKFSQFGYLGIGIGADLVGFAPVGRYNFGGNNYPYAGTYLPVFLHYAGDILHKRITPFYSVDMGYAVRFNTGHGPVAYPAYYPYYYNDYHQSGAMGGVGFGVKFFSRHRVNFNLSLNADFQNVRYIAGYDVPSGNGMTWRSGNSLTLLTPGLKFGLGF